MRQRILRRCAGMLPHSCGPCATRGRLCGPCPSPRSPTLPGFGLRCAQAAGCGPWQVPEDGPCTPPAAAAVEGRACPIPRIRPAAATFYQHSTAAQARGHFQKESCSRLMGAIFNDISSAKRCYTGCSSYEFCGASATSVLRATARAVPAAAACSNLLPYSLRFLHRSACAVFVAGGIELCQRCCVQLQGCRPHQRLQLRGASSAGNG